MSEENKQKILDFTFFQQPPEQMTLWDYENEVGEVCTDIDDLDNLFAILYGYFEKDESVFEKNPDEKSLFIYVYPRIKSLISVMADITRKSKDTLSSLTKVDINQLK